MTEVWCVLRSGGDYGAEHVARLSSQVEHHGGGRLHCLTDTPWAVADTIAHSATVEAMHFNWPGWWSKIELYLRPGPILYLDLDVTVVGDLRPLMDLAERLDLIMCRGFWGQDDPNPVNSSIVGWSGDQSAIAEAFLRDVPGNMARCSERTRWGDQGFVLEQVGLGRIALWQEALPGSVRSFKCEYLRDRMPATAILASHGKPRPWEPRGADAWLLRQQAPQV